MKTSNSYTKTKTTFVVVGFVTAIVLTGAGSARADTWTQKTDMPTARWRLSTSVVDGKIYAIGGIGSFKKVEEYDPATDTWTQKADMPTGRVFLASSTVDAKIYAIGGATSWPGGTGLATVEEYDPATDTWTTKADMPTARKLLSTGVVNGKIYAFGGQTPNGGPAVSTVEEYDPVTDTWMKKADMPAPRGSLATIVADEKIYAFGGNASRGGVPISTLTQYEPATDTWTAKDDMPVRLGGMSTSAVDGRIYVIGRTSTPYPYDPPLSTVWEYDTGLRIQSPDFNGDGLVDIKDLLRLIQSWGQDDPMVDIAPPLFGDGVVDALDLELWMSYWGQSVDDPTLIAHWALDEAEGAVAHDSAGVNDAFVVGGTAWQPNGGQVDGALQLDGVDGCAVAGPVLNPADGSLSVLAWIQGGAPGQVVISQLNGANWLQADSASGCLMTELCAWGRTGGPLQSETKVIDSAWHRIGFVWDGFNRSLYIDDILVVQDTRQGLEDRFGGLNIGCGMNSTAGTFWSGLIDEVRIYSRAVSS